LHWRYLPQWWHQRRDESSSCRLASSTWQKDTLAPLCTDAGYTHLNMFCFFSVATSCWPQCTVPTRRDEKRFGMICADCADVGDAGGCESWL
jgi:hypothetical protein